MAHDTEKLRELLERVETASGLDRMLDAKLYAAFAPVAVSVSSIDPGLVHEDGYGPYKVDEFTASLDASIALVERMLPGWDVGLETGDCIAFGRVWQGGCHDDTVVRGEGQTPSLAVLSALLRALISQAEGEGA